MKTYSETHWKQDSLPNIRNINNPKLGFLKISPYICKKIRHNKNFNIMENKDNETFFTASTIVENETNMEQQPESTTFRPEFYYC